MTEEEFKKAFAEGFDAGCESMRIAICESMRIAMEIGKDWMAYRQEAKTAEFAWNTYKEEQQLRVEIEQSTIQDFKDIVRWLKLLIPLGETFSDHEGDEVGNLRLVIEKIERHISYKEGQQNG